MTELTIDLVRAIDRAATSPDQMDDRDRRVLQAFGGAVVTKAASRAGALDEEGLARFVAFAIKSAMAPLVAKIAELEQRPHLKNHGLWKSGVYYRVGSIVSADGSSWLCAEDHTSIGRALDHAKFKLLAQRGPKGEPGDAR